VPVISAKCCFVVAIQKRKKSGWTKTGARAFGTLMSLTTNDYYNEKPTIAHCLPVISLMHFFHSFLFLW
jgi:hypothetical protein